MIFNKFLYNQNQDNYKLKCYDNKSKNIDV